MKRLLERNYCLSVAALVFAFKPAVFACKLDCSFVCFCARVAEINALHACCLCQFFRKSKVCVRCIVVSDMDFFLNLVCKSFNQNRIIMSEAVDTNARDKINIFLAVLINKFCAVSIYKSYVKTSVIVCNNTSHIISFMLQNHRSYTAVAENFEQKRVRNPSVNNVCSKNTAVQSLCAACNFWNHAA